MANIKIIAYAFGASLRNLSTTDGIGWSKRDGFCWRGDYIFGGSGGLVKIASRNCAAAASRSSGRRSRPDRRRASGACPGTRRFNTPCATTSSTPSAFPDSMSPPTLNLIEPPWYGSVCPVVWEGWHREVSPYPDQSQMSVLSKQAKEQTIRRWTA